VEEKERELGLVLRLQNLYSAEAETKKDRHLPFVESAIEEGTAHPG
jgi:hypothetical protein